MKCLKEDCLNESIAKQLCNKHYKQQQRANNPEQRLRDKEYTKRWKEQNPEKHAAQQARKHEKYKYEINAYTAQWKKDNWETYKYYLAARKQRVKQATPKWADLQSIEKIYKECPKAYHVDHIVPINGKNVCGLHVPCNLQYLPSIKNLKKSNKAA